MKTVEEDVIDNGVLSPAKSYSLLFLCFPPPGGERLAGDIGHSNIPPTLYSPIRVPFNVAPAGGRRPAGHLSLAASRTSVKFHWLYVGHISRCCHMLN